MLNDDVLVSLEKAKQKAERELEVPERDTSGDSLLKSLEKPQGAHRGGSPRGQHRDASSEAMFRQTKAINNQARSKRFDTICRALLENNEEFRAKL